MGNLHIQHARLWEILLVADEKVGIGGIEAQPFVIERLHALEALTSEDQATVDAQQVFRVNQPSGHVGCEAAHEQPALAGADQLPMADQPGHEYAHLFATWRAAYLADLRKATRQADVRVVGVVVRDHEQVDAGGKRLFGHLVVDHRQPLVVRIVPTYARARLCHAGGVIPDVQPQVDTLVTQQRLLREQRLQGNRVLASFPIQNDQDCQAQLLFFCFHQ